MLASFSKNTTYFRSYVALEILPPGSHCALQKWSFCGQGVSNHSWLSASHFLTRPFFCLDGTHTFRTTSQPRRTFSSELARPHLTPTYDGPFLKDEYFGGWFIGVKYWGFSYGRGIQVSRKFTIIWPIWPLVRYSAKLSAFHSGWFLVDPTQNCRPLRWDFWHRKIVA